MNITNCNNKWDDQRTQCSDECPHLHGVVKNRKTGEVYGAFTADTNEDLYCKFVKIPAGQLGLIFLRPLYRLGGILTGDWIRTGCYLAEKEWQVERQEWSIKNPKYKLALPGRVSFIGKAIKHSLWQLVKNIAKAVTYPLAALGIMFAALYGTFINIHTGREYIAKIENAWARDLVLISGKWDCWQLNIGEYLAPCMQPQHVYEYVFRPHMTDTTSQRLQVMEKLLSQRKFFENEGIDVSRVIQVDLGWRDCPKEKKDKVFKEVENCYSKMLKELNNIEKGREAIIQQQLKQEEPTKDMPMGMKEITRQLSGIAKLLKKEMK